VQSTSRVQLRVEDVAMVRLLGTHDRLLKVIERQFPLVEVAVRGNEITLDGDADQVRSAVRLVEELITMIRGERGASERDVDERSVTESAKILRDDPRVSPAEVLRQAILTSRG
jgi:phosphate starvation-inducible PhoH-like protein